MEGLWALTKSSCGAGRGEGPCVPYFIYLSPHRRHFQWLGRTDLSPATRGSAGTVHNRVLGRRSDSQSPRGLTLRGKKKKKNCNWKALIVKDPFHGSYADIKVGQTKISGSVHLVYLCFVHLD